MMAWWDTLRRLLYEYRWRLGIVVGTILVACVLAVTLTPYQKPSTYQPTFIDIPKEQQSTYMRAEIIARDGDMGTVRMMEGPQKGLEREIHIYNDAQRVGTTVLLSSDVPADRPASAVMVWRMPWLLALVAAMIGLVVLIGGRQGVLSIGGLAVSVAVIGLYVVPAVLGGANALAVSVVGAFIIATIAIVIAHTFRWRTIISLMSIYISLAVVVALAALSGWLASLSGVYDDVSGILAARSEVQLDMYGILLGGIIIAALGVLDDVVTTQVATVDELYKSKRSISRRELFTRGMSVGREHLSALINTLALAYIGVALPTVIALSFVVESNSQLLMTLNAEYLSVEIIRTAIASIGIILAIPVSTGLAVLLVGKKQQVFAILKRVQRNPRR